MCIIYIYILFIYTHIYIYMCVFACVVYPYVHIRRHEMFTYIYMYDPNHELGLVVRRSVLRVFQEAFQYSSMVEHWIFFALIYTLTMVFFLAGLECRNWLSYGFLLWTR